MLKNIFWNQGERRIRAGWRYIIHLLLYEALLIGFMALMRPLVVMKYGHIPTSVFEDPYVITAFIVVEELFIGIFLIGLSLWICGRFFDKRPLREFGLRLSRHWWGDLVFGLLLGGFLMTLIFLIEVWAGWVTITGFFTKPHLPDHSFFMGILPKIAMVIGVGIREELWIRGYQLTNLAEGFSGIRFGKRGGLILATIVTSILFGLFHTANPNATVVSTIFIMVGGLLLATGFILTGELAIPIGLHITWNFFQNTIFGFPVSGFNAYPAYFIALEQNGPELMTGGNFGPEAGLLGLGAMMLGILITVGWVRWRTGQARLLENISAVYLLTEESTV